MFAELLRKSSLYFRNLDQHCALLTGWEKVMKADSLKIAKVFSTGGDVHYALPHFQREYAWEKEIWKTLLNDTLSIYELYSEEAPPEHFMGTLVVINDGVQSGTVPVFRLVDGQQRLTTISLMLCALSRIVENSHPLLRKKIYRMLVNEDEGGDLYFKLLPTTKYGDQISFKAIILGDPVPMVESKIPDSFNYFYKELSSRITQEQIDPELFFIVLTTCLQAVFIDLDKGERPYEIFESLNFKGKTLSQADLVRNYIAMKLPQADQASIFHSFWSPIEEMLQEKRTVGRSRLGELTAFLRHYLAYLSGVLINEDHVYSRFRDRGQQMDTKGFIEEIKRLKRFAGYYERMLRPEKEPNQELRYQLQRLNTLEFATAYPFLLYAYDAVDANKLTNQELVQGLKILESYMVRRYLVRDSVGYINRMFPALRREIDLENFSESLNRAIASKNYPVDARLRQAVEVNELYTKNREKLVLVLSTINRQLSEGTGGYTALDGNATIEHIMPQTPSDEWRKELGENIDSDYELLHTIGNLTLVTQNWNNSLSNSPFDRKRQLLSNHALRINSDYFSPGPDKWDGEAIKQRGEFLAELVLEIWPAPDIENVSRSSWTERPKSLTILGELFPVKTWRDVVVYTAEIVSQFVSDFEQSIVSNMPTYFSREEMQPASRPLKNGWWVYLHLSGKDSKRLCNRMIEYAEIPEEEFEIETW
jgi:uncharacterized protein with ParB-like and HNH nuclease domain